MPPVRYSAHDFPPPTIDWKRLAHLLGPASAALARYDSLLEVLPNPTILLAPMTTQEAVLSSRIEGTQATMGDVLAFEAGVKDPKRTAKQTEDIFEVINYRRAMHQALEMLKELPLCQRILREAHRVLLEGVRGQSKRPGEYRKDQNWIGLPNCDIADAHFIPADAEQLPAAMDAWEAFIHAEYNDRLVQLALLHVEFEAIHPFGDGNGRLGRMLVPLFLFEKRQLSQPIFYISAYFEAHRDAYYERLRAVTRNGDWMGWCEFFLLAIIQQAEENLDKARRIFRLYQNMSDIVRDATHSQYAQPTVEFLFRTPFFKISDFSSLTDVPEHTARRILAALRDQGLFREIVPARGRIPAIFAFRELLNIAEGYDAF